MQRGSLEGLVACGRDGPATPAAEADQRINSVSLRRDALERIIGVGDRNCIWELRMNVNAFAILCELLKVKGGLTEEGRVSIAEQIIIFLIILGHHKKNRSLQVRFYRSGETISRYFNRVLYSIIRVQSLLFAKAEPVPEGCVDPRWKWFKGCLGALDGTYIDVSVPEADKPRFRTRKGRISTNVLGVCNRDMNFVYVLSGWEGSASDSRILRDAIGRRNSLQIPLGSYYLVDAGYTNGQGFLAPYRGTRYHVQEWAQGSRAPQNYQEYFNKKHSSARNIIERCFGLLKKRWTILRSPSFYPIKTQNRIIIACCLLQNFIRMNMDSDPEENTTIEPEHMPVGEDFSNVEVIESVESSNEWTQRRETLAIEMFEEWRRNRTAF
ncbi:protein ANTAGONIST OF LIKE HETEROCHROMATIN PROTEIN 1-like [Curcuma longa]|uniref:protein ANTAGONIST OF LIKE HETEROCHROMATIN PROTEIN 1-like n=1 Tax=Curcuma longa TaxID=136217 RepID=UPI003D9DD961